MISFINFIGIQQIFSVMVYGRHWPMRSICLYVPCRNQYIRCLWLMLLRQGDLNRRSLNPILKHQISCLFLVCRLGMSWMILLLLIILKSSIYILVRILFVESFKFRSLSMLFRCVKLCNCILYPACLNKFVIILFLFLLMSIVISISKIGQCFC